MGLRLQWNQIWFVVPTSWQELIPIFNYVVPCGDSKLIWIVVIWITIVASSNSKPIYQSVVFVGNRSKRRLANFSAPTTNERSFSNSVILAVNFFVRVSENFCGKKILGEINRWQQQDSNNNDDDNNHTETENIWSIHLVAVVLVFISQRWLLLCCFLDLGQTEKKR